MFEFGEKGDRVAKLFCNETGRAHQPAKRLEHGDIVVEEPDTIAGRSTQRRAFRVQIFETIQGICIGHVIIQSCLLRIIWDSDRCRAMRPWSHHTREGGLKRLALPVIFLRFLPASAPKLGAWELSSFACGKRTVKHAPPSSQFSPERVPPCASMMLREMASPIPVPSDFVEKNGSKSSSAIPLGKPGPVSRTLTIMSPFPARPARMKRRRVSGGIADIASRALSARLRSTCKSCTGSPQTWHA